MNAETEETSHLLNVGCIGALCVGLTIVIAMGITIVFPNVKVPPVLGFCGGGSFAMLIFGLALWAYFRKAKLQAQEDNEDSS